jgi:hypothetical protein
VQEERRQGREVGRNRERTASEALKAELKKTESREGRRADINRKQIGNSAKEGTQ